MVVFISVTPSLCVCLVGYLCWVSVLCLSLFCLAYRLYTVVPRLVRFINQLTNWYVGFNRRRVKVRAGLFGGGACDERAL